MDGAGSSLGLVLDLEPGLGAEIEEQDWADARLACTGEVLQLQPGRWEPLDADVRAARCGWVVVDGVVSREMALGEYHMIELLGPGDPIGVPAGDDASGMGTTVTLVAASDVVLLGLGTAFLRAAQRWPSLLWTLLSRREAQRERLAMQGLIGHFPRAETRVLLMLWHLAQRWGRVTPEGIVVPFALTHAALGQLTGARRSTVTLGVTALESEGLIHRARTGFWVITAAGERVVHSAVDSGAPARTMLATEWELLRERIAETMREAHALRAEAKQTLVHGARGHGGPVPAAAQEPGATRPPAGCID